MEEWFHAFGDINDYTCWNSQNLKVLHGDFRPQNKPAIISERDQVLIKKGVDIRRKEYAIVLILSLIHI